MIVSGSESRTRTAASSGAGLVLAATLFVTSGAVLASEVNGGAQGSKQRLRDALDPGDAQGRWTSASCGEFQAGSAARSREPRCSIASYAVDPATAWVHATPRATEILNRRGDLTAALPAVLTHVTQLVRKHSALLVEVGLAAPRMPDDGTVELVLEVHVAGMDDARRIDLWLELVAAVTDDVETRTLAQDMSIVVR